MQDVQAPLSDAEIDELQQLLDRIEPPLEPLDTSSLDGYLCGVLLQPLPILPAQWQPGITDLDARALPRGFDPGALLALSGRRHAELHRAITGRQWFDPWIYEVDEEAEPQALVLPWAAGFAAAMDRFPALMQLDDQRLMEPLALIYAAFDPDDLEDADELLEVIETIEPPSTLDEAVEDIVRAVLLIADVSRPRPMPSRGPRSTRRPPPRSPSPRRSRP